MLVDKYARQAHRQPKYELQTFYGQLENIYAIHFSLTSQQDLGPDCPSIVILAAIRSCILETADSQLKSLDIRYYTGTGALHVIDITSVQCVVGHIWDRNKWAIIDRSSSLARAFYVEDD
jgi:hypothetical protein